MVTNTMSSNSLPNCYECWRRPGVLETSSESTTSLEEFIYFVVAILIRGEVLERLVMSHHIRFQIRFLSRKRLVRVLNLRCLVVVKSPFRSPSVVINANDRTPLLLWYRWPLCVSSVMPSCGLQTRRLLH